MSLHQPDKFTGIYSPPQICAYFIHIKYIFVMEKADKLSEFVIFQTIHSNNSSIPIRTHPSSTAWTYWPAPAGIRNVCSDEWHGRVAC